MQAQDINLLSEKDANNLRTRITSGSKQIREARAAILT